MSLEHAIVNLLNLIGRPHRPHSAGLVLGHDAESGQKVIWPNSERDRHCCVVGKTGSGKTHLLLVLASQLVDAGEPFVFLDYHGDAAHDLVALTSRHPEAADRLVLVDPTDRHCSPGLNPLELDPNDEGSVFGRTSELATILRQRWRVDAFGPRTEELLRNTLFVLAATGQTLIEAPLLLTSREFRSRLLSQIEHPDCLDYWRDRFEPLSEPMKAAFREPLLNRITGFLIEPACRHFLGQPSTFTFTEAADAGCFVIVNLARGKLREHAHTLGNLIFARLQFEILARANRPRSERPLLTIFADEVQNLAENDLGILLTEGRKFRASLVTGQQHWDQTPPALRGALLSAGTHIFFNLSAADAGTLAAELSPGHRHRHVSELTELRRGEAITRTGAARPTRVFVPPLPTLTAAPDSTAHLRSLSVHRYGRKRSVIEAAIRARREVPSRVPDHQLPNNQHAENEGQQDW